MRYLAPLFAALFFAAPALAACPWKMVSPACTVQHSTGVNLEDFWSSHTVYTESTIPTCDSDVPGLTIYISNATDSTDCDAGTAGTVTAQCACDGVDTWEAMSGSGGEVLLSDVGDPVGNTLFSFEEAEGITFESVNTTTSGARPFTIQANQGVGGGAMNALNLLVDNEGGTGALIGLHLKIQGSAADSNWSHGINVEHGENIGTLGSGIRVRGTSTGEILTALLVNDAEIVDAINIGDNVFATTSTDVPAAGFDTVFGGASSDADAHHTHKVFGELTLPINDDSTVSSEGEIAVDRDFWGAGYDAIEFFNDTDVVQLVAVKGAPSNFQVPAFRHITGPPETFEIVWEDRALLTSNVFSGEQSGPTAISPNWVIGSLGRAEFAGYLRADQFGVCTLAGCNAYVTFGNGSETYFHFWSDAGDVILDSALDMSQLADYEPLFGANYGAFWVKDTNPPTPWFTEGDGDTKFQLATVTDLGDYLPLTGGTLSGDLTIEAQIIQTLGTRNVIIGDATAGNGGVTDDSVVLGDAAGANLTGDRNILIGTNAGTSMGGGANSVIVGYDAGASMVLNPGVFIGKDAGKLTTGNANTFVGYQSGAANTTSASSTFIGYQAGLVSTGGRNTFVGAGAGAVVTTGVDNVIIGVASGIALEDGEANVIIGPNAGVGLVSGGANTIIGKEAGGTGDFSQGAFFGYRAGKLTTGANNSAFGAFALPANLGGGNNAAFGYQALNANTTGNSNTVVGSSALASNQTGHGNVAIGYQANRNASGASHANVAIGQLALKGATATRVRNTAVGNSAGEKISSGSENVFIGEQSGWSVTTASNNTIIGSDAGRAVTGGGNVFLGWNAGQYQVAVSDKLIIDNRDRTNAANELTNALIVGDFAAAPADQTLTLNAVTTTAYDAIDKEDSYWVGAGSGIPYGAMYAFETTNTVTIGTASQWEEVTAGMTTGSHLNEISFANNHELSPALDGKYKVTWSLAVQVGTGANIEAMGSITVDGADAATASASSSAPAKEASDHTTLITAGKSASIGGSAIVSLTAGQVVSFIVMNETNTTDLIIEHANMVLDMVGGS